MKTRIIAIVFGVLISATAFAQRGGRSPEERAEKVSAHLTEKLSLSDEQATEVKEIYLKNMEEGREKAKEVESREDRMKIMKEQHAAIEEDLKAIFSEKQFEDYLAVKEEMGKRGEKHRGRHKGRSNSQRK